MANETLFKVYKTGETVLAGSLAAIVPNHYHDDRYYTEEEIDSQKGEFEEIVNALDDKLTNEETGLLPTLEREHDKDIAGLREDFTNDLNVFKGKSTTITLAAANWIGTESPFYQNINISLATVNSKIDLQPTVQQIVDLQDEEVTLVVENDNGILKVWAIGYKPSKDYEIQATITNVATQ